MSHPLRLKPTMTPTAKLVAQALATPRLSIHSRTTRAPCPQEKRREAHTVPAATVAACNTAANSVAMLTARAGAPLLAGTRRLVHCVCAPGPGAGNRPHCHSWRLSPGPARLDQHGHDRGAHGRCSTSGAAAAVTEDGVGVEPGGQLQSKAAGSLVLYNTLSRRKEVFTPRGDQGNRVSLYVCGVTVYDYSHIGHARVYVAFDTLFRALRHRGYDVTCVALLGAAQQAAALTHPTAVLGQVCAELHGCGRQDHTPRKRGACCVKRGTTVALC